MDSTFSKAKEFKRKYPLTMAFRIQKHASVIDKHLHSNEKINYVFCGQKGKAPFLFNKSCVVAITNERLVIGQKRLLWGYFFTTVTPDVYNDFKIFNGMIWSDILIDTLDEEVFITKLAPDGAIEVQKHITKFMMEEKKKYAIENK